MNLTTITASAGLAAALPTVGIAGVAVAQAEGTVRYLKRRSVHRWRGRYTVGAGVPTPWGPVKVWSTQNTTDWRLRGDGSGRGRWT